VPTATPSVIKSLKSCLQRHGVAVPSDGTQFSPPPGYDPDKARAAFQACLKHPTPQP
jgi:hypothetical protein